MAKRVFRVTTALAVLTLLVTSADAETVKRKKKKSFFDNLFGTSSERAARAEQRRKWWLEDNGFGSDYLLGEGSQSSGDGTFADYGDPEPIPGFGMGNVAFVLPRQHPVFDKGLAGFPADGIAGEAIRLVLSDKATPVKTDQKVRESVLALYKDSKFRPLWMQNGAVSERANAVLMVLKSSGQDGLEPGRYLPAGLTSFDNVEGQIAGSSLAAAQFDVGLTAAVASYAMHISGGAFEPGKLSLYHDVKPEAVEPSTALKVLAYTPYPTEYLKTLAPAHPAYALLKAELAKVSDEVAEKPLPFPPGKRVKIGQKDVRIPELRQRMVALGHMTAEAAVVEVGKEDVFDKTLGKAVKAYQMALGLPQTSALDQATTKSFGVDNSESEREKIISSLERIRWLPKSLGARHVFVNQASYEVNVMDGGRPVWTSRVIVGRPTTQTSVFSDEMETVVFNPTWGMPASILVNEYLGKLRRDPGYFDRIGYQVVNANGKKVSSRSVNWGSVGPNSGIGVVQPAGDGNALGEIKFLFPNSHSIYMHDTPNRELFAENRRAFSHGCVRVQNPREFAKVLMGLTDEEVAARIANGNTQNVKLEQKVPVHLTYFTAWPDNDGKIRYFPDIYERDKTLRVGRAVIAKAFGDSSTVKIVEAAAKPTVVIPD